MFSGLPLFYQERTFSTELRATRRREAALLIQSKQSQGRATVPLGVRLNLADGPHPDDALDSPEAHRDHDHDHDHGDDGDHGIANVGAGANVPSPSPSPSSAAYGDGHALSDDGIEVDMEADGDGDGDGDLDGAWHPGAALHVMDAMDETTAGDVSTTASTVRLHDPTRPHA
ncbi:hypothetical protein CXG81DRAFT_26525 [Caulochytrium protostelioides]|uniref:Uncharacterized protein n=1 Tax=Caulochytrium protostelioides TaxID=1555241 RepID=A0A4P9X764_9FUNG|nr:hypothetical protein CXG81DRAFT_26525 [Caulochytrium protostelioides]|eukprot:RKP00781.1 hypothetical protein CXG81DRAFT_26525 [Caulochytrium protostelioides]